MLFQDVDVDPSPDEKSVMTYVAQFLHRYPEGAEGKVGADIKRISPGFSTLSSRIYLYIGSITDSVEMPGRSRLYIIL